MVVVREEAKLHILLIESNKQISKQIRSALSISDQISFNVESVSRLRDGVRRLQQNKYDAILLDFSLTDNKGLEALRRVNPAWAQTPVLVLVGEDQEAVAKEAVRYGAQDYLLPRHLDNYSLSRALHRAIESSAVDLLSVEKNRALVTLDSIGDAVLSSDLLGRVTYLNGAAEKMTGWTRLEALGQPLSEVFRILDSVTREIAPDPLQRAIDLNRAVGLPSGCVLLHRDGTERVIDDTAAPIHDSVGTVIGAVIVFHDMSEARATAILMASSANHDPLTKLPNRILLSDRISQAISISHRKHRPFAVMFLDLDYFKAVNDSLGHAIGDKLLQAVADRLLAGLRNSDTVSRQGGDEFVILLPEIENAADAASSAKKLLLSIGAPYNIDEHCIQISGSFGISLYPDHGDDAETVLNNADIAMYEAKETGRNAIRFFKPEMGLKATERQSLEVGLRRALEQNEFCLYYQPKVSLALGQITGAEALIRWQDPMLGLLLPAYFVTAAESSGLIVRIGRWVMREACRQASLWQTRGLPSIKIAVNVSAVEFQDRHFVEGVKNILRETGLEPGCLQLELTEGVLMKDADSTASVLRELRQMGVQLAIDDFGAGYSSLSYLRQFPIDILKIDQSFVNQIGGGARDGILISAIIGIGRNLNYIVVAEGIETIEQKVYLQGQRCDEGQGYLFSHPLVAHEFERLLQIGIQNVV
ncbi:putative bifunctional diguanylate cyclase/phosphodiesterase [Terriglobus saanensis]|uniref:Response regulator receiver modulated diguanylate cyclase/phosphodiesterase with PAS/PAC sensor(S) n=1 Tax=Terriglobus saanensis (strain ATCC BAA-1853 / DSM 23119 / SP1PR4) TaxID=401053 RepID=E8V7W6_TERSS|nr:EAL domain-containing protein [Terriglobus saanensis]ADV82890.1 response regulator receiver modulated diguanylate cyclase/phosphodiesterase with PAS/PAC sensor(s) [Terriglobus saanensis SP1PR4]